MTLEALHTLTHSIIDLVASSKIEGLNEDHVQMWRSRVPGMTLLQWRYDLWFKFSQGWGQEATLNIKLSPKEDGFEIQVTPSWGTTSYTLAQAKVAAKLHMDVIELGEKIEALA